MELVQLLLALGLFLPVAVLQDIGYEVFGFKGLFLFRLCNGNLGGYCGNLIFLLKLLFVGQRLFVFRAVSAVYLRLLCCRLGGNAYLLAKK